MARMTVTVDEEILEEARKAFDVRTKGEAIRRALEQAVRRRRLEEVLGHAGRIQLDLDREELRRLREEG